MNDSVGHLRLPFAFPFDLPPDAPADRPPRSSLSSPVNSPNLSATSIRSPSLALAPRASSSLITPGDDVALTTPSIKPTPSKLREAAAAEAAEAAATLLPRKSASLSPTAVSRLTATFASRSSLATCAACSGPGGGSSSDAPRTTHPGRPARPARCAYASALLGKSACTTSSTPGRSRPRAATSVATRTSHSPARREAMAASLAVWGRSP